MKKLILVLFLLFTGCSTKQPFSYETIESASVRVLNQNTYGGGTGFAVSAFPSTLIVTNAHVCEGEQQKRIDFRGEIVTGSVVKIDLESDLCLLEAPNLIKVVPLRIAKGMPQGGVYGPTEGAVYSFGFAYLDEPNPRQGMLTLRTKADVLISYELPCLPIAQEKEILTIMGLVKVCIQEYDIVWTTLETFPGNSGSAVVNGDNEVVGVIALGSGRTGYGGMVPLERLRKFLGAE